MEWIDVNERLPNPSTDAIWVDDPPYINHNNNLVLVITHEIYTNKRGESTVSIDIETAMYTYDDCYKTFVWRGIPSYKEVLYWCEIPKLPCVDFYNINGIKGILESSTTTLE